MDHLTRIPGPEINGQWSIISLLTPKQLKVYPYLQPLRNLVNAAFQSNHNGPVTNYLFPTDRQRLVTDDQLGSELGPSSFTFIISSPVSNDGSGGPPRLYASASGRPYIPKEAKKDLPKDIEAMHRTKVPIDLDKYEAWELKILVVDPTLQKQGLGSLLMKLVEAEVVKRSAQKRLQASKIESTGGASDDIVKNGLMEKKVIMLLDGVKETVDEYYLRRGWVTTEVKPMENGALGASREWEACFMQKDVTL
ncbi:hypothetical protein FRB94_002630 [Tulasnella sp. JGI-2019a]|nr:hypothetical protein FRB94_002630 [Tulasnella sp. JGI-2019a]